MHTESRRHWRRRPIITASEIVVWVVVTALTVAALICLCLLLTLAAPS